MQNFERYSYTIKEKDLLKVIHEAANGGCFPLLYINGEYYNIEIEKPGNGQTKDRIIGQ